MQPEVEAHNSSASTTGKSQVVAQTPLGRMTKAAEQVVSMNSMSPHQEEAEGTRPNPQDAAPMDLTVQMATTLHLLSAALHTLFLHDHHNLNHDTPAQPGLRGPPRSAQRTDPAAYSGFRRSCGYTHGHVSQCHGTSRCSSTSRRFGASTDSILSSRVAVALATLPLASLSGMILGVTLHARLVALCLAGAHERARDYKRHATLIKSPPSSDTSDLRRARNRTPNEMRACRRLWR